ncbi:MAG: protease [Porphyromonadaceae bacterium CG2_30_38_12]|nr:MAG: protease [Porphyromonadaceae bacterium CG2_30_38_12]
MQNIELLAPAKNSSCGIAAINHGADAVYIGAEQFGARAAAGNSITDIEHLIRYAHQYHAKVFVALNTVLTDSQLAQAQKLIGQLYEAGADALIVQDMGILKLDLPPIALHASTQTDNRTVVKVRFLQQVGFSRVVLARELSLAQISEIASQTDVALEAFVHGALCVSYSGQCYMSEAMCGRSANRGQCAQYCRLPYSLEDATGNILVKNKHLLSMKDLDLSEHLEEMMLAGVQSFKIEGRLKDEDYVKNITAYYRSKLDNILGKSTKFRQASAGKTTLFFEPNPEKSFRRGATDYFLHNRHAENMQLETPKSMGEAIGKVLYIGRNFFEMQHGHLLNNGDGLCFINKQGDLSGFRVNKVDRKQIFPADMPRMEIGTFLYRNQDQAFDKIMKGKTAERKIEIAITLAETLEGFSLSMTDEMQLHVVLNFPYTKQLAQKPEGVQENIRTQLAKLGNTVYKVRTIEIAFDKAWFIPASLVSEWRRQAVEQLDEVRKKAYQREPKAPEIAGALFPTNKLTYLGNVTNELAKSFYSEHGVDEIAYGFEIKAADGVPLMFTKHCIKYEMGWCPRQGNQPTLNEPLFLKNNDQRFELNFDCKKCEMHISLAQKL